jgi:hypothetical protein
MIPLLLLHLSLPGGQRWHSGTSYPQQPGPLQRSATGRGFPIKLNA